MNRPELWLVRHGETEWSRSGRHTGDTDLPLTPEGEAAAASLVPRLAATRFDLVLTSPRQRARRTAALAGVAGPEVVDDLREWDYGSYEGVTTADIRAERPGWSIWTDGAPGGESPAEVTARADRVVELVVRRSAAGGTEDGTDDDLDDDTERVLAFGHGHFSRVLAVRWLGLPVETGARLRLDTATVSVLSWERDGPAITRWNA